MAAYTPGMEITGGSLGHGPAIAVGMALALKRKASKSFVYRLFSDGELDEGAVWEAAMSAGSYKLDKASPGKAGARKHVVPLGLGSRA